MQNNKIYTTRNGKWLIEYPKLSSSFFMYLFKKILVFFIDYSLFYLTIGLLYFLSNVKLWQTISFSFILFFLYYFVSLTFLNGATIGMKIAGFRIINRNGYEQLSSGIKLTRSFFASIIVVPFVGWIYLIVNILSSFLLKGLTVTDVLSLTIIANKYYIKKLKKIQTN